MVRTISPRATGTPASMNLAFMRDLDFMSVMWSVLMPGILKSVRSRASVSSQNSLCDSSRSILPWRKVR